MGFWKQIKWKIIYLHIQQYLYLMLLALKNLCIKSLFFHKVHIGIKLFPWHYKQRIVLKKASFDHSVTWKWCYQYAKWHCMLPLLFGPVFIILNIKGKQKRISCTQSMECHLHIHSDSFRSINYCWFWWPWLLVHIMTLNFDLLT